MFDEVKIRGYRNLKEIKGRTINAAIYKEEKVKDLNIRKWECPSCTSINERDINSSINIMFEGIKRYMKQVNELQVS